jgi:outer membrane protein insertion porin family
LTFCHPAGAAELINRVLVEGNIHVTEQEILDVVETKIGDDLSARSTVKQLRDDFRAVFALGYFSNLVLERVREGTGFNLVFHVEEKPIISDFNYEGNQRYKKKKLNEEIKFTGKERIFFDENIAETYKKAILEYYTRQSFPNTTITWRKEELESPDKVVIVFEIQEGKRLPVKKIVFEGNAALNGKQLRKKIQTKQSWWFIIKHHYDPILAEQDLDNIKLAYWDIGYLDAKAKLGPIDEIKDGLQVTFLVEEGEPYTVGEITVENNSIFSSEELLANIRLKPGDTFSASVLTADEISMINMYRGQGYLDTRVPPMDEQFIKDQTNRIVDIRIPFRESPRKYLGKVEIQGVVILDDGTVVPTREKEFKTKEFVIRREIELSEGEPLDWTKVIESDRNLVNLNFFRTRGVTLPNQVNLAPGFERRPTNDPNVENLLLRLEETQTGMFTFGGGFSTTFGPSIFATISERNLFGYGVRGSITGEIGKYRNRLVLNIFEPHLLNSDYSLDWDIYYIDRRAYGGRSFDEERIGSSVTFGKEITDELTLLLGLKGEVTDLRLKSRSHYRIFPGGDPVAFGFPDYYINYHNLWNYRIPDEFNLGQNTTTSLLFGAVNDYRDFRLDPTSGHYERATIELAGLTDNEFVKLESEVNYYYPIYKKLVLAISNELDLAYAYGGTETLPLQERFFIGGARTIRGFDEGGIGPQSRIHYLYGTPGAPHGFRTFLGGEAAYVGSAEVRYPFTEIFQGVVFFDMGTAWEKIEDIDPSEFRFSTGLGLRVRIPGLNAILRLDFPVVLRKFDDDDTQFLHFSFGQTF